MRITELFDLDTGHEDLDFVDIDTTKDTKLFIDPCLIEIDKTRFGKSANMIINDYFDAFYSLFRNEKSQEEKGRFLNYAHEINATKLGYGSGNNGKGKTSDGMIGTFKQLQILFNDGIELTEPEDLKLFIYGFAEDCLSDMLTNILFNELNKFTIEQCKKNSWELNNQPYIYNYWDCNTHNWKKYSGKRLSINNETILLVPKQIVCKSFNFKVESYFKKVIVTRIQEEKMKKSNYRIKESKENIKEDLIKDGRTVLDVSIDMTKKHPEYLRNYHSLLKSEYSDRVLSNAKLDKCVYNK